MLLVAIAVAAVLSVTVPGFMTAANIQAVISNVSVLGILGLAMAVVVIARGIDLSLVATMAVSSAVTLHVLQGDANPLIAILTGLTVAVVVGVLNGVLIAFIPMPALITTLASGVLLYGVARATLFDLYLIQLQGSGAELVTFLGQGRLLGVRMSIVSFLVAALLVHLFLSRTSIGRYIYMHGDNPEAAALTGIRTRPLMIVEYVLCSMMGNMAGLVLAGSSQSMNMNVINSTLIFDVVLAVVLGGISLAGGRGGVVSVIAGVMLIGIMVNGMTVLNLDAPSQSISKGVLLLAAIVLDHHLHPRDEETVRQGD